MSALFALLVGWKSATEDGIAITACGAFTLTFAHAALFLRDRVYSRTENEDKFLTIFALIVGYLSLVHGVFLIF